VTVITDGVVCAPRAGTLYDVLDLILDRGIVIDAFVRVSLVGIEILKIDARIVVASVDTYLRFAEVCNRLDLEHDATSRTVPELFGGAGVGGGAAKSAGKAGAKKAVRSAGEKVKEAVPGHHEDSDSDSGEEEPAPRRRTGEGSRPRSRRHSEED
jgi:hypothetical protein